MRLLLRVIAITLVITLIAITGVWYLLGGRLYSVQTGSMQPVLSAGDAVLISKGADFAVGDIVSFRDRTEPRLVMTHRVIQLAGTMVTTKGDHNPEADLPIAKDQIIGKAYFVAPWLGRVLNWLRRPMGLVVAVYIPAILAIATVISREVKAGTSYRLKPHT